MPLALAQADRYAWGAVRASVQGERARSRRLARLSRITRNIANEVCRFERRGGQ